ncbi:MAG: HYR domain-containing protein [Planctomycetes bacterium]|nr:HYR domain-containing protein [Planctomycetota bacterium]
MDGECSGAGRHGWAAFLSFDDALLNFENLAAETEYTNTPFDAHIQAIATSYYSGLIHLDGNKSGAPPTGETGDALLATLLFSVDDLGWQCTETAVAFETFGPFNSELSYQGSPIGTFNGDIDVSRDTLDPVITLNVTPLFDADPTDCEYPVEISGSVSDNCCIDAASVAVSFGLLNEATADIDTTPIATVQDGPMNVTFSATRMVSNILDCPVTVEASVTAQDCCGNVSLSNDSADVNDVTDPVFDALSLPPNDITVECDAIPAPAVVTATDNCDTDVTVGMVTGPSAPEAGPTCPQHYTFTRTWTATDECDNDVEFVQTIHVQDTTAPVLSSCPSNATVECDAVPPAAVLTATDNCDPSVPVTFVEWVNAPLLTGGALLDSPAGWGFQTQATARGNLVTGPAAPPLGVGSFQMITGPGAGSGGKIWLATGNFNGVSLADVTALSYSTYVSTASLAPVHISIAINLYVDLDGNGTRDTTLVFEPVYVVGTQGPVVQGVWQNWDALDGPGWWYTTSGAFGAQLPSPGGEYKALSHYIGLFPNARISAWNADPRGVQLVAGQNGLGAPWANFDGSVDNFVITDSSGTAIHDFDPGAGISICNGSIERTWSAEDDCGNGTSCLQTLTVQDTTPPDITCPVNITVNADAGLCTAVVAVGSATAIDNCDDLPIISWAREDLAGTLSAPFSSSFAGSMGVGVTKVTWTATDHCGNSSSCDQLITVNALNEVVNLEIELQGVSVPVSRCIRFIGTPGACQGTDGFATLQFVDHDSNPGTPVRAIVPSLYNPLPILLPCGVYTDICAKDEQRSLLANTALTDGGTQYSGGGLMTLMGGDTDNDSDVDINDVTFFIFRFGTADPSYACGAYSTATDRGSDFSANGNVGSEDYVFLSDNWLEFTECPCSAPFITGPGDVILPMDEVVTLQPRVNGKRSLSNSEMHPAVAAKVDINRDGKFDYRDVEKFEKEHGYPSTLSTKLRGGAVPGPVAPVVPSVEPSSSEPKTNAKLDSRQSRP